MVWVTGPDPPLQALWLVMGWLKSRLKPGEQYWQWRPAVWWRQFKQIPPLRRPESSKSSMLKRQRWEWRWQLQAEDTGRGFISSGSFLQPCPKPLSTPPLCLVCPALQSPPPPYKRGSRGMDWVKKSKCNRVIKPQFLFYMHCAAT